MKKVKKLSEKITSKYFEQSLVDAAYELYVAGDKDLDRVKEVKALYVQKDAELKASIKEQIASINEATSKELAEIEANRVEGIKAENEKFAAIGEPSKDEKKEHTNILNGVKIFAKRAKIKANNANYEARKAAKLARFDLHREYAAIVEYLTGKVAASEAVKSRWLEEQAAFDVKRFFTNGKMWVNLIPTIMLVVMIVAFLLASNSTGYNYELETIINDGIFVAVVATGAVFIYSQGGFDMSLGNASLLCALLAGFLYISTKNIILSLVVAVAVGALLGIINAVLATMLNLPVMVMTLTMMNIIAAVNDALIGGKMFDLSGDKGEGMITNSWIYAAFLIAFFALCVFIFNYTKVGRRNKFIGSNKVAAKFNGINLMKAGIISFAISGVGLGICGFIFINSKSGSIFSPASSPLGQVGLNVIIAIIFGGMTTSGGPKSKVTCAVIGAFFVVFLQHFFNALGVSNQSIGNYQYLAKGAIFIVVAAANMWDTRTNRLEAGGSIQ